LQEEFEDTKGVKSESVNWRRTDKHNDQKKKDKKTNN